MSRSDDYHMHWSENDRMGEIRGQLKHVVNAILCGCGGGSTLDVGSGGGALVRELLDRGVAAFGVDSCKVAGAYSSIRMSGRLVYGVAPALPFVDLAFETIVSVDYLEYLSADEVLVALREIHRVSQKSVFLRVATTQSESGRQLSIVEGRSWWEAKCFDAGFRKHPSYYKVNDYDSLGRDDRHIYVLLEKVPQAVGNASPQEFQAGWRGLQVDMLRKVGARTDAFLIRYHWAAEYVKAGDRVLDACCGFGYGVHVMQANTRADTISGIDDSAYAIEYAKKSFSVVGDHRVSYELGVFPDALAAFADGSIDLITSFETLEYISDPILLLREFHRILTPGGRILVCVPNDCWSESGQGRNSQHLQVYDWSRLSAEISQFFILEDAYGQTAAQSKDPSLEINVLKHDGRLFRQFEVTKTAPLDCEWWLMVGMKSPVEPSSGYKERVFANIADTGHPSISYRDVFSTPWLMYSMVNISYRLRNRIALGDLCRRVMERSLRYSNDYKAALCVQAYLLLGENDRASQGIQDVVHLIDEEMKSDLSDLSDPMAFRWQVSLLFVKGKLLQALGELSLAICAYVECASYDVRNFGVHLATKTTEASFIGGRIAQSMGSAGQARECWSRGVEIGNYLLSVSLDDILMNREHPNLFNHGDGVREYTVAWDNIARCANGLALLAEGRGVDEALLQGCFQTEYAVVNHDLLSCRTMLDVANEALQERTQLVLQSNVALETVTRELSEVRALVTARTAMLEESGAALISRTDELIQGRQDLIERTVLLTSANTELVQLKKTLGRISGDLEERAVLLEQANDEIRALKENCK